MFRKDVDRHRRTGHVPPGQIAAGTRGGAMPPNGRVALGAIKDGTSQTFLIGEQSDYLIRTDGTQADWRACGPHGLAMGNSTAGTPPTGCGDRAFNTSSVRYPINAQGPVPSFTGGWAADCTTGVCSNTGGNTPMRSSPPPRPGRTRRASGGPTSPLPADVSDTLCVVSSGGSYRK